MILKNFLRVFLQQSMSLAVSFIYTCSTTKMLLGVCLMRKFNSDKRFSNFQISCHYNSHVRRASFATGYVWMVFAHTSYIFSKKTLKTKLQILQILCSWLPSSTFLLKGFTCLVWLVFYLCIFSESIQNMYNVLYIISYSDDTLYKTSKCYRPNAFW